MTSLTMKLRSTDTSQNQEDENTNNNDPSERISALERTIGEMTKMLTLISLDLKELKVKPTSDSKVTKLELLENIDKAPLEVAKVTDPITYIKLYSHYAQFFPSVSVPSNFKNHDQILKFIIDIEQKFAYHGVPQELQVKMFLKRIEGSSIIAEFFRHTKLKKENDNTVLSSDIEAWEWMEFKTDFISLFIDSGAIYNIMDTLNSWKYNTFKTVKESIDSYERLMKFIIEINMINGGEVNMKRLTNDYKIQFIRTIDSLTHSEVIRNMEIHQSSFSGRQTRNIMLIHDLDYDQLVEILLNIENKRQISKSLYDNQTKFSSNQKNQGLNELSKSDVYKAMACHQFAADNCTLGEKCKYSHEKHTINEYKKSIGEKVEKN